MFCVFMSMLTILLMDQGEAGILVEEVEGP